MIRKEFKKDILNNKYEQMEDGGLFLPRHNVVIGGHFHHSVNGGPNIIDKNLITNEGLNHFLGVTLAAVSANPTWYVGIFEGNYTPQPTDTGGNIATNSTESNSFASPTARKTYTIDSGDPTGQALSNFDAKASFTMDATVTIYGAFLISDVTVNGTAGVCVAASRFAAQRDLVDTDEFLVGYSISAADA